MARKNIVITIGNYGSIITVHKGKKIENKIFLNKEDFNQENKDKISAFFKKNKSLPSYILIDTLDQTYKKKRFPSVNPLDLRKMAHRSLSSEGDKDSLKNFMIINKKAIKNLDKKDRHWDCLFISSPQSEEIKEWIRFLVDMPNYLVGIYMLPVECYNLFKLIKNSTFSKEEKLTSKKKNDLYCIIIQNKVSGIRQIVFSQDSIVFTRVVTYEFAKSDFVEKFEQDIYSTFEYLKRIYSDLQIEEMRVINIFSKKVNSQLQESLSKDLSCSFLTPHELSKKINLESVVPEKSKYCDVLISKIFSSSKKVMKFQSPKLKFVSKFFNGLQFSYFLNLALSICIAALVLFTVLNKQNLSAKIENTEIDKFKALKKVTSMKLSTLNNGQDRVEGVNLSFERIADFGKIDESIGSIGQDIFEFYKKLSYLQGLNLKIKSFVFNLQGFNHQSPIKVQYLYKMSGDVFNESGDIEDLFREFDSLTVQTRKKFEKKKITFSELPKNIDFSQKYYSFPVFFSIEGND